jgi:uncharacterized protein HemX
MRRTIVSLFLGALLAVGAVAQQTKPTVSDAEKARLRDLQYQITKVEATMMQLQIQFQQLQQQHEQLTKQLNEEIEKVKKGVDPKQWVFDVEKLEFVPAAKPGS